MAELNGQISKAGKQQKPFPPSPFGQTPAALVDFRGLSLREKVTYMTLERHDFSLMRCEWAGCFVDCKVKDSVLDKLKIDGWFPGTSFEGCSFIGASASKSSLGPT